MERRQFLQFLGRAGVVTGLSTQIPLNTACSLLSLAGKEPPPFSPCAPNNEDDLKLADGFYYNVLIRWDDPLNKKGERFGFDNDFIAILPTGQPQRFLLWVNHESANPLFVSAYDGQSKKTKKQVVLEQKSVGGSCFEVEQDPATLRWSVVFDSPWNRRIDGTTPIPFSSPTPILGSRVAIGTLANCGGGVTPWGTILTCEENYDHFYGESPVLLKHHWPLKSGQSELGWEKYFPYPPEHYGWVVEYNPQTGKAKKMTALGRFAHEMAMVRVAADGRCVVYSGDDGEDMCLYKFIADRPGSLDSGQLLVANLEKGRWIPLNRQKSAILQKHFKTQLEVLMYSRVASQLVGGTPLNRPEGIDIDPKTGAIIVALTKNKNKGDPFGSLLKINERDNNPLALEFQSSTFLSGGPESGFACPDNLAFDKKGNLWMTCDISDEEMNQGIYKPYANNSLFYIPLSGSHAGQAFRVATGPIGCEFTGPRFSADGRTLFLSIQHPGENTKDLKAPTSHWPDGGDSLPRPSVVTIQGPALDKLVL